jgi:hypothetical protein
MNAPASLDAAAPAFCTIPRWCELTGMSRSATYEALGRRDIVAKKVGKRTLVNYTSGISWINSLPDAQIRPAKAA